MVDLLQLELQLRLAGERMLADGHAPYRLPELAGALIAGCGMSREVAAAVLRDYQLAQALRVDDGFMHPLVQRMGFATAPASTPAPFAVPRVHACDLPLELRGGIAEITAVSFVDGVCVVTADEIRFARRGGAAPNLPTPGKRPPPRGRGSWPPGVLVVEDDAGNRADAHFSGGGSVDDGYRGEWRATGPLSPSTRWLEIDKQRVDLGEPGPSALVRIEPMPDRPLPQRYLWHRLACEPSPDVDVETVIEILVAAGAIKRNDPALAPIRATANALTRGHVGPGVPPPWDQIVARHSRDIAPAEHGRFVPAPAAANGVDGTNLAVLGISVTPWSFTARVVIRGPGSVPAHHPDQGLDLPLAWWAADDRGNWFVGRWSESSSSDLETEGEIMFGDRFDPKALVLRLMPSGLHTRAVIEIPLPRKLLG